MKGLKVICIDATPPGNTADTMAPLKEGRTYTIRDVVQFNKRPGYLLEEIINSCTIINMPGVEPGYATRRFIPLSDKDELEQLINLQTCTRSNYQ